MEIKLHRADAAGKFEVNGPGRGFMLQAFQDAYFPLDAVVRTDGKANQSVHLVDERPLFFAPFTKVEFTGAPASSWWLVYLFQNDADAVGAPRGDGKAVRIAERTLGKVLAAGTYYVGGTGTNDSRTFDVSRFSQVVALINISAGVANTGTESLKAFLNLTDDSGLGGSEDVPCGSTNEFFVDGGTRSGSVSIGEGLIATSTAFTTVDGRRWPAAVSFRVTANEPINTEEGSSLQLWGIP
jgi:hypothetical protein